jgi:hypothetical protein
VVTFFEPAGPTHPASAGSRGPAVIGRIRVERLASLLTVALAASACSEPVYATKDGGEEKGDAAAMIARDGGSTRQDASVQDAASEELIPSNDSGPLIETSPDGATVQLASSLPDWAAPLLGSYAARSYSFAQDKLGARIRAREYLRIEIVETSGADPHVELRLHMCDSLGDGETADTQVVAPELTTVRVHRVLFGNQSWATQVPAFADGFTLALPERCVGKEGNRVPKDPGQSWIVGNTCLCPASVDAAPSDAEDCRIIDQDGDLKPGSTMEIRPKVLGLGPAKLFVATVNQTTFVNGTVGSDGRHHSAQLVVDQRGWQLGCEPACTDISSTPPVCPPERSKLELVRSELGSCSELIASATTLFPNTLPEYPPSCP